MKSTTDEKLPRYALFPNGTSFMIWSEMNCDRCVKGPKPDTTTNFACPIEDAIMRAAATDGTLLHGGHTPLNKADAIAKRLGWDGRTYLEHACPEFVP